MDETQQTVKWFFTQWFAVACLPDELSGLGPTCDRVRHERLECCPFHRALANMHDALNILGDRLNDQLSVGGVPHREIELGMLPGTAGEHAHRDPNAAHVGSTAWIKKLSDVSNVPLPDKKPIWW